MKKEENVGHCIDPEILTAVRGFRRAMAPVRDQIYDTLVRGSGCGPFDGGCVAFARALQQVVGGEVAVILRAGTDRADHAAVYKDGLLIDYDGPAAPAAFCKRFAHNEHIDIGGWRLWKDGDLHEAVDYEPSLEQEIAMLLKQAFLTQPAFSAGMTRDVVGEATPAVLNKSGTMQLG